MKNLFLTFLMLAGFSLFADDLYVNSSGLEGTYYTIQAAVDAAEDGDNIYIATVGTYSEDVTVDKTLFLVAAVPDEYFTLSGDILISNSVPEIEVSIIGLNNGSVKSVGSSTSSEIVVNVISSFVSEISGGLGFEFNVYDTEVYNDFVISNGSVKGSIVDLLDVTGDYSSVPTDTVQIMGSRLGAINWVNDEHYFEICNNYMTGSTESSDSKVDIANFKNTSGGTNMIANNTIIVPSATNIGIFFDNDSDGQNLVIVNNYISINYYDYMIYSDLSLENAFVANNFTTGAYTPVGFSNSSLVDNAYQYSLSSDDESGEISDGVDLGLDWTEYRDIDNTVNDIGTGGGPHAWSNYNPTQGKAAIVDLELPFQLYIGGIHNVKAKSIHKN